MILPRVILGRSMTPYFFVCFFLLDVMKYSRLVIKVQIFDVMFKATWAFYYTLPV